MKTRFQDSSSNLKVKILKTKTTKPALIQMQASVYIYNLQKKGSRIKQTGKLSSFSSFPYSNNRIPMPQYLPQPQQSSIPMLFSYPYQSFLIISGN